MTTEWQERQAAMDAAREQQTEALSLYGFGPAFSVGGGGPFYVATHFATCRTCGAMAVILPAGTPEAEQPVALHKAWHDGEVRR